MKCSTLQFVTVMPFINMAVMETLVTTNLFVFWSQQDHSQSIMSTHYNAAE